MEDFVAVFRVIYSSKSNIPCHGLMGGETLNQMKTNVFFVIFSR